MRVLVAAVLRGGLRLLYLALAMGTLLMAVSRLAQISLTTDELLEYQGVVDHWRFGLQVLHGGKPDLHSAIVYNLENYGIVAKLPAFLISLLFGGGTPPI
ncbi:hypothetical protein H6G65_19150 [Microcystis elabens FACHB-917]|nr:hypothetical protein [Microcystis elabens FACHB-917]